MKYFVLLVLFVFLTGCGGLDPRTALIPLPGAEETMGPTNMFLRNLPQGNDSYSVGFRDGCNTYMAYQGTGVLQFKEFRQDNARMIEDQMYAMGYEDGRNHCTYIFHPAVN